MGNHRSICAGKAVEQNELLIAPHHSRKESVTFSESLVSYGECPGRTLFDRLGGGFFLEILTENLPDISDSERRNIEVDVRSALMGTGPFDAKYTSIVVIAIEDVEDIGSHMKQEAIKAIYDASIESTGRRCPLSGTLQRDESDVCPITKMGLSVANQKKSLLEELGTERLEKTIEQWVERIRNDSACTPRQDRLVDVEVISQTTAVLKAALENSKIPTDYNKIPTVTSTAFHLVILHLKQVLEALDVRPMVVAETCNRAVVFHDIMTVYPRAEDALSEAPSETKAREANGANAMSSSAPSVPATSAFHDKDTLFTRIGGEDALRVLVDRMYERICAKPDLKRKFSDIPRTKAHQMVFLTAVLNEEEVDTSIKDIHDALRITEAQFDAFTEIVAGVSSTMLSVDLVTELLEVFMRYEPVIVTKEVVKVKPKPFTLLPPKFKLPTAKERSHFKMLADLHWPRKARDDMIDEIKAKFKKNKPKSSGSSFIPDASAAIGANLTLKGAHTPMARPDNVDLPSDFRKKLGTISLETLAKYRATNHRKLLSVYGLIFDVSDRPDKYGVGAPYEELTGKDITWGLACGDDSPPNANIFFDMFKKPEKIGGDPLTKGKRAPDYDMLFQRIAGLQGWIMHYKSEYGAPVGTLDLYEEEECLCYPPEIELGCTVA